MNGGYYMIDLSGLDLTDTDPQTVNGLYAQMQKGIKSGKPLVGFNSVWGTNSDSPMTPICFFAQQWSSNLVVGTASILNISCTDQDVVTVTSLVS